jgi:hypothetical protein
MRLEVCFVFGSQVPETHGKVLLLVAVERDAVAAYSVSGTLFVRAYTFVGLLFAFHVYRYMFTIILFNTF